MKKVREIVIRSLVAVVSIITLPIGLLALCGVGVINLLNDIIDE